MDTPLSERARNVLQLADDEAHRLGHEWVGTEHLLLGLVAEGNGVAAQPEDTRRRFARHSSRGRIDRLRRTRSGGD